MYVVHNEIVRYVMDYQWRNKLGCRLQRLSECEGCVQKHSQPQRVVGEPVTEMLQNIILPRGSAIGQYSCRASDKKVRWTAS